MSPRSAEERAADPSGGGSAAARLCVLIACYAARGGAARARREVDKTIRVSGGAVLDHVVVKINGKGMASVYDPRRTVAGALTPALTWGVFGLLAGGLDSLVVWAVLGFVSGGLYAYFFEHLLTKQELGRLGRQLPAGSSALVAFVRGTDADKVLAALTSSAPVTASVAAIRADLSATVQSTPPGSGVGSAGDGLTMIIARYAGERGARVALAHAIPSKQKDKSLPLIELFVETNGEGRRRVSDPNNSGTALSIPDAISWAAFGLVWGLIVGFAAGGGILSFIENGVVVGVLWGIFGLVAGTLYGLWAGRGVSARRLKGIGPLLGPNTSAVVAWADGSLNDAAIKRWAEGATDRLYLRFAPVAGGAALARDAVGGDHD